MRVAQLGEPGLIELLARTVRNRGGVKIGIGDDAAVLSDGRTVITTDSYAEGVHFDLSYMDYYDVGTRCACACLSDVVAMGAQPTALFVALGLPAQTALSAVRRLYRGLDDICKRFSAEIAGGDTIKFDRLFLTLTALGTTPKPLLRSKARPGDLLCVTGYLGLAETGRLLLAGGARRREKNPAVNRHLRPLPRLQVLKRLRPVINALIDTSDGIATDARHLALMSRVRILLKPELLPVHPLTLSLTRHLNLDTTEFCLTSGEDYELLFTTRKPPPNRIRTTPITVIGRVEKGTGLYIEKDDRILPLKLTGYDHLKSAKLC